MNVHPHPHSTSDVYITLLLHPRVFFSSAREEGQKRMKIGSVKREDYSDWEGKAARYIRCIRLSILFLHATVYNYHHCTAYYAFSHITQKEKWIQRDSLMTTSCDDEESGTRDQRTRKEPYILSPQLLFCMFDILKNATCHDSCIF